ncbi:MAG TPA: malto-oligosyltrehalose synthase, partial [Verrucomicrobiae bacterium]|nr:malto-oligosyltrehalose synthase [Verrucomicrobiae bacterium]
PHEWQAAVSRWSKMNEQHRSDDLPDRNMEYLFYQTLVGAWPITLERLQAYMEKASCEAKQHTDWDKRNTKYDEALKQFVAAVLADDSFTQDMEHFIESISEAAQVNSLAQILVKLTAPGVPDIYQGNELWDFSLVDPDNRRPVDFAGCEKLLNIAKGLSAKDAWARRAEGLPKLWLTQNVLQFRARHEAVFRSSYTPLPVSGEKEKSPVAFMRGETAITVIPRFHPGAQKGWANTQVKLPEGMWRNEFTGERFAGEISLDKLFGQFPVALLAKGE